MPTVEDLVVRAKPSGLDETTEGIEGMEEGIEESAESMGDASEQMDELSSRWTGAFRSMVAGMAVAVGGLLTQVPVVGELMSGLSAIMQAFGFQIDQLLRDLGAGGLTGTLFEWADAIFQADGALGDLVGGLGLLTTAVGAALTSWFAYTAATQGFGAALGAIASKVSGFVGALTGLASGAIAAAAAFGALLGLFGVAVLEVTGVMDAIENLGETIRDKLPNWARDGLMAFLGGAVGILATVGAAIAGFVEGTLEGGLSKGIDQAVADARDVLGIFAGAWDRTLDRIGSAIDGFISWVGRQFEKDIVAGISTSDIASGISDLATGGGVTDAGAGGGFRAGRSEQPVINLDGKNVTSSTGRWRADETSRRGRNG